MFAGAYACVLALALVRGTLSEPNWQDPSAALFRSLQLRALRVARFAFANLYRLVALVRPQHSPADPCPVGIRANHAGAVHRGSRGKLPSSRDSVPQAQIAFSIYEHERKTTRPHSLKPLLANDGASPPIETRLAAFRVRTDLGIGRPAPHQPRNVKPNPPVLSLIVRQALSLRKKV